MAITGWPLSLEQFLALPELRVNIGQACRVPDVAFYSEGRVPPPAYPTTAPQVAIEIASPGQSRDDLGKKCAWYFEQGSRLEAVLPGLQLTVNEVFAALG